VGLTQGDPNVCHGDIDRESDGRFWIRKPRFLFAFHMYLSRLVSEIFGTCRIGISYIDFRPISDACNRPMGTVCQPFHLSLKCAV